MTEIPPLDSPVLKSVSNILEELAHSLARNLSKTNEGTDLILSINEFIHAARPT